MHRRRLAILLSVGLAAVAGCKAAPYVNSHIETVNAEYRQLEDYVYCLEDENARLNHELEALRAGRPAARTTPRRGFLQRSDVPEIEVPDVPSETPPRRLNRPELNSPRGADESDLQPPTVELSSAIAPLKPADTRVTQLFLNPVFTGGDSGSPSDEGGLTVLIEPRNAAEQYVPEAGAVSIVVLDPSKPGDAARVARWDFDAPAVLQKLDTPKAARGIHLTMPWPAGPPTSERLHVFVRYETADGRRIQTDREIVLLQPGQASQRWTPRQPGRNQASGKREPSDRSAGPKVPEPAPAEPIPTPAAPETVAASPPAWSPLR